MVVASFIFPQIVFCFTPSLLPSTVTSLNCWSYTINFAIYLFCLSLKLSFFSPKLRILSSLSCSESRSKNYYHLGFLSLSLGLDMLVLVVLYTFTSYIFLYLQQLQEKYRRLVVASHCGWLHVDSKIFCRFFTPC